MGHPRQMLVQLVDEARLPGPGLTEDHEALPLGIRRPLPTIDQRCQLRLASDERGQPTRGDGEEGRGSVFTMVFPAALATDDAEREAA